MIIRLKRFGFEGRWRKKIASRVKYPTDFLDLSDYIYDDDENTTYKLYAVINHYACILYYAKVSGTSDVMEQENMASSKNMKDKEMEMLKLQGRKKK